ncbi:hypothetical protein [Lentzea guizhouensis]|uniref:hypothetical protein n=1 Tax=Lentzea guizhouensis TaxID=1586287 RepID=UPI0012B698B2|nr:hypothetical protein [Lentzea guizhouensis]
MRTRKLPRALWLAARLWARIKRAERTQDSTPLFDQQAVDHAAELWRLHPDQSEVQFVVGWFHYLRLGDGDDEETEQDRRVLTDAFRALHRRMPGQVPADVREFLEAEHAAKRTAIRLLSPRALLACAEFPAYRDLTDFTEWHPDDDRRVVFVSHRWTTATHPDPDGRQFLELLQRLRELVREHPSLADCGVFYDYWSMPQHPRSEAEDEVFRRELGRLSELVAAADHVIILSEGYRDYRDRAWCVFEAFVAATSTLDWSEGSPTSVHYFPDQDHIEQDLAFLRTTMFQTVAGKQVKFLTSWHHSYRPDMKEAEAICAIFQHLGTCRTTEPGDHPLVKLQLAQAMNRLPNLTPYGRLLLGIHRYFDATCCVLTDDGIPLPLTLHFKQPDWARIPAYHQIGERERYPGPFCLSPEQVEVLQAGGGSRLSMLRFAFTAADLDRFHQAKGWEEYYVPAPMLIHPTENPFPTLDHLVHTILELGPAPLFFLPGDDEHAYFPLADQRG